MRTHLVSGLLFTCFAALGAFGGCAVDVDPQTGDELGTAQDEAIKPPYLGVYYTLNRCVAPFCHGYYLKEVNNGETTSIAASVVFSGIDESALGDIKSAPWGDVMVRGYFAEPDLLTHVRKFIVTEAYRGLPGVDAVASDLYFHAPERNPPIFCIAAPCNNIIAKPVNTNWTWPVTRMDLDRALKPMVDGVWLEHLIRHHDALVSAHFASGDMRPGGRELVLQVSQIWLKLPVERNLCMVLPHHFCGRGLHATFTRDVNRCLEFDTCADMSNDLFFLPPKCDAGYVRKHWAIEESPGIRYACDPEFAH